MMQPKKIPETWPFLIVKPEEFVCITIPKHKNKIRKYRPRLQKRAINDLPDSPY